MSLWCWHQNQTSPRRDEQGEYCRCLDCGARIAWQWRDPFPVRPRRPPRRSPWKVFSRGFGIKSSGEVRPC